MGIVSTGGSDQRGLIHTRYFSRKDINVCLGFDISTIDGNTDSEKISDLPNAFRDAYVANNRHFAKRSVEKCPR